MTAKRERKQVGIKLTPDIARLVIKALKRGAEETDETSAKLCAEALEAIDSIGKNNSK